MEEVFRFQLNGYELLRSVVTNAREYPRLGFFGVGLCVCSLGAALMGLLAHLTRDPDS